MKNVPGSTITSEIWSRRLAEVIEKHAASLVASMTFWLGRDKGLHKLGVLAAVIDISSFGIGNAIMSSTNFWISFDNYLHQVISAEYTSLPDRESQPIDLVFHGVGGVAYAAHTNKGEIPILNAEGRYADICRLLSMKSLAGASIRYGHAHAPFQLAIFAEDLRKSCPGKKVSPHVSPILEDLARVPKACFWLDTYFGITDRCHNWRRHNSRRCLNPSAKEYSLIFKKRARHNQRLRACSGCRAVHYCSRECQKEDWTSDSAPHKTLCSTFRKLFDVHDRVNHTDIPITDLEHVYDNVDIPKSDLEKAVGHAEKMFLYFSEYEPED